MLIKEVDDRDGDAEAFSHQLRQLDLIQDIDHLTETMVPTHRPVTRKQFLEAQKYWPCHFYEDKRYGQNYHWHFTVFTICLNRIEQFFSSHIFSNDETKTYEKYMQAAKDEGNEELVGL